MTVAELGAEPVLGGDVGVVVFAALDADTDDRVDELLDEPDDPQAASATAAIGSHSLEEETAGADAVEE